MRKLGETADFATADGKEVNETALVLSVSAADENPASRALRAACARLIRKVYEADPPEASAPILTDHPVPDIA